MSLRPTRNALNGLLLVDKEPGMTSHDVVAKVRKILQIKEVGHSGTLDPMAEGLMVLLVGSATKLSPYILTADKSYRVGLRLGVETDTLDRTGNIVKTSDLRPSKAEVLDKAQKLLGEFQWSVPHYSAVKVQGQKMYEKARQGIEFETPIKSMSFMKCQPIEFQDAFESEYFFEIECSKGSYIRSWVQKLGESLGCGATMSYLRRLQSMPFQVEKSLTLKALQELWENGKPLDNFIPNAYALPQFKRVHVQGMDLNLLLNGQISFELRKKLIHTFIPEMDDTVQIMDREQRLLALVGHEKEKGFHIRRVFPESRNSP